MPTLELAHHHAINHTIDHTIHHPPVHSAALSTHTPAAGSGSQIAEQAAAGPEAGIAAKQTAGHMVRQAHREEDGLATAEYGIVMLAAVAFAGLLTAVLTSDTVQGLLENVVQRALS